jgi:hypothetical protein
MFGEINIIGEEGLKGDRFWGFEVKSKDFYGRRSELLS